MRTVRFSVTLSRKKINAFVYFDIFSSLTVKKGMVFNVNLGMTNLQNKEASDSKGKDVALFVGDTVLVTDEGATLLTPSKKKIKNIAIFLKVLLC